MSQRLTIEQAAQRVLDSLRLSDIEQIETMVTNGALLSLLGYYRNRAECPLPELIAETIKQSKSYLAVHQMLEIMDESTKRGIVKLEVIAAWQSWLGQDTIQQLIKQRTDNAAS